LNNGEAHGWDRHTNEPRIAVDSSYLVIRTSTGKTLFDSGAE
jgi:hypothetical protein